MIGKPIFRDGQRAGYPSVVGLTACRKAHSVQPLDLLDVESRLGLATFFESPLTGSNAASMRRDGPSALGELLGKGAVLRQLLF